MKILNYFLLIGFVTLIFPSCNKDPKDILVSAITSNGISFQGGGNIISDLNAASSATNVPLNAIITVKFDKAIDVTTANSTNVKISTSAGDAPSLVSGSGTELTIDPILDFTRGTQYTLSISCIKAADGGKFTPITRTFTTEGKAPVIVPKADQQIAYWNFDNNVIDQLSNYTNGDVTKITFGKDRFNQSGSTASFDGDESIIEVLDGNNLMRNKSFTLSLWVKTNSANHLDAGGNPAAHFVLGLAAFRGFQFEIPSNFESCKLAMSYEMANGTFESEDLWFPGNGQDKDNGGWQGWDYVANLTGSGGVAGLLKDKWAHIICTYDASSRKGQMFINGQLMKSQDFNLWPDNAPKKTAVGVGYGGVLPAFENILAFGFIKSKDSQEWANEPWGDYYRPTSNHFKGDLDDVRFFKTSFTAADAAALYNAEK